jgi:hypothetical protein
MVAQTKTSWRMSGDEFKSCNCAWGCPCDFNARPTQGSCEGFVAFQVRAGHFGDTTLDGLAFAAAVYWPGALHEGNGTVQPIVDERATPQQREALLSIMSGQQGGTLFEILAAICPDVRAPRFAPIQIDMPDRRHAIVRIPGLVETHLEPIKNPVTGEEHTIHVLMPEGFEYHEADILNSTGFRVTAGDKLTFNYDGHHGSLAPFEYSNA